MKRKIDYASLLNGPILPHVIRLAVPMIIAFTFVTAYQYVDRFFVSRLGDVATAAIGMAFTIQMVIISLGSGIGNGVNSFISRNLGANKVDDAERTIIHAFLISLGLGLLITTLGLLTQRALFSSLGAEGELLELILAYLTIIFWFTPVNLITTTANSVYQGWGDTVSPMKFMLLGNILNLILDPLLIFGYFFFPSMGIKGAAWATVIGRLAALLYVFYKLLLRHQPTKLHFSKFRYDKKIVGGIFQVGLPASLSQVMTSIAMMFVFYVLDPFGSDARAAYTIVFTYEMAIFLPSIGIAQAVSILTGHNFGARLFERVNKVYFTGMGVATAIMTVSVIVIVTFADFFAGIFAQSEAVRQLSAHALRITALGHFFTGVYISSVASFQGLGLGRHYLFANILKLYIFQVPVAFFGAKWFGLDGVWYGLMLVNVLSAIVLFLWHQYIYRRQILSGAIQPL